MTDDENKPITIRALKKEFDEFKEWVTTRLPEQNLKPVHGITENINPVNIPDEPAVNAIRFHLTNKEVPVREFDEETHGENWREIANEFHKNNTDVIRKREDL